MSSYPSSSDQSFSYQPSSYQTSLFSVADLPGSYSAQGMPLEMSADALQEWKQRILHYQQQLTVGESSQQGTLFDLMPIDLMPIDLMPIDLMPTVADIADRIDPFQLPQQNIEFWRWRAEDEGVASLYFVVDYELPIVLYVGETVKSNQRWKGEHDCKRYILNYVSAHRPHGLKTTVNIGFWANAPVQTRDRQKLESALISRWRSPFNKENWGYWGTPFIGHK